MTRRESSAQAADGEWGTELSDAELASVQGCGIAQDRSVRKRPRGEVGRGSSIGKRPLGDPLDSTPPAIPDPVRVSPEDDGLMGGWGLGGQLAEPGGASALGGMMGGAQQGAQQTEAASTGNLHGLQSGAVQGGAGWQSAAGLQGGAGLQGSAGLQSGGQPLTGSVAGGRR